MTDESIFAAARAIGDPAERAAYLDRACGGDAAPPPGRGLLAADGAPAVPRPAAVRPAVAGSPTRRAESAGVPGTVIAGRYKLLQEIGEGGMGTVWMAEQTEPVRRQVAAEAHQGRAWTRGRCWPGSRRSGRPWP